MYSISSHPNRSGTSWGMIPTHPCSGRRPAVLASGNRRGGNRGGRFRLGRVRHRRGRIHRARSRTQGRLLLQPFAAIPLPEAAAFGTGQQLPVDTDQMLAVADRADHAALPKSMPLRVAADPRRRRSCAHCRRRSSPEAFPIQFPPAQDRLLTNASTSLGCELTFTLS
jgi:hypothetical protein